VTRTGSAAKLLRTLAAVTALAGVLLCVRSDAQTAPAGADRPITTANPPTAASPAAAASPPTAASPTVAASPPTTVSPPTAASPAVAASPPTPASPAVAASPPTAASPSATANSSAVIQQPRPFGYVLGDVLTQRVLLQAGGHYFDPIQLPPVERVGLWLSRRSSSITRDDSGRRWLVIDYQLINAPQQLTTVDLPTLTLGSKTGNETLLVPAWPISVAPLTPRVAFAKGGLQDLRPDHPAPALPTTGLWRQFEIWLSAWGFVVVAWLLWWLVRYIRTAANQPFARALREIRNSVPDSPQTWLALHRAFDATADRSLQLNTLPALFKRAPYFEPQRAEIERFYVESTRRFFGGGEGLVGGNTAATRHSTPDNPISLRALCTALRRIEKQYER
jgi:mxaA protein